jgi:hypothetical protein
MDAMLGVASPHHFSPHPAAATDARTQSARELAERFAVQLRHQLGTQLDKVRPQDVAANGRLHSTVQRLSIAIGTKAGVSNDVAALVAPYALLYAAADQQRETERGSSWTDPALSNRREANDFALWEHQGELDDTQVALVPLSGELPVGRLHLDRKSAWEIAMEESLILQHDPDIDLSEARPSDFKTGGKHADLANSVSDQIAAMHGDLDPSQRRRVAEKALQITALAQGSERIVRQPYPDPVAEGRLADLESAIGDQTALDFDTDIKAPPEFEHKFRHQDPVELLDAIEMDAQLVTYDDEKDDRSIGSIGLRVPERTSIAVLD